MPHGRRITEESIEEKRIVGAFPLSIQINSQGTKKDISRHQKLD